MTEGMSDNHVFCSWALTRYRKRLTAPAFAAVSPRRRIITTGILLFLVSTIIPYQFAYMVACIVQIATCTRALRLAKDTVSSLRCDSFRCISIADHYSDLGSTATFTTTLTPFSFSCFGSYLSTYQCWWFGYITLPCTGSHRFHHTIMFYP